MTQHPGGHYINDKKIKVERFKSKAGVSKQAPEDSYFYEREYDGHFFDNRFNEQTKRHSVQQMPWYLNSSNREHSFYNRVDDSPYCPVESVYKHEVEYTERGFQDQNNWVSYQHPYQNQEWSQPFSSPSPPFLHHIT